MLGTMVDDVDPWAAAIECLTGQLAELVREDPDPEVLDRLQNDLEALRPALAQDPPPGQAAAWAEAAREAGRLTEAVAEAAAHRRKELHRERQSDHQRARGLAAYGEFPRDDPRFIDRRS